MVAQYIHYFAYGSNLHPERLRQRVPSAQLKDVGELPGYELKVHKRGMDGSAKCNAVQTGEEGVSVHGALFEIASQDKDVLDYYEDHGQGYLWTPVTLLVDSVSIAAYTYLATPTFIDDDLKPFDWYRKLVVLGLRYHQHPESYIVEVEKLETRADEDGDRARENEELINSLVNL